MRNHKSILISCVKNFEIMKIIEEYGDYDPNDIVIIEFLTYYLELGKNRIFLKNYKTINCRYSTS